jgi:hypothetical protein
MPANIGALDRGLRIAVGLVLLSLVFAGPRTLWGFSGFFHSLPVWHASARGTRAAGVGTCDLSGERTSAGDK